MNGQKPMWQRMKEKFEEEESLEKERIAKEKEEHERKMRKILNELDNGSTYIFRENELTSIVVSNKNCILPKAIDDKPLFSQWIMARIVIGGSMYNVTLPIFETHKWEKWVLLNDYSEEIKI